MIIQPTVGRIVWYTPSKYDVSSISRLDPEKPLAAIVTHVWSERMVNLTVFDSHGGTHGRTSVPLLQEGDTIHESGFYCEWMPYQKGQAAKAEGLLR